MEKFPASLMQNSCEQWQCSVADHVERPIQLMVPILLYYFETSGATVLNNKTEPTIAAATNFIPFTLGEFKHCVLVTHSKIPLPIKGLKEGFCLYIVCSIC